MAGGANEENPVAINVVAVADIRFGHGTRLRR
jgi:hypothetical protein